MAQLKAAIYTDENGKSLGGCTVWATTYLSRLVDMEQIHVKHVKWVWNVQISFKLNLPEH